MINLLSQPLDSKIKVGTMTSHLEKYPNRKPYYFRKTTCKK